MPLNAGKLTEQAQYERVRRYLGDAGLNHPDKKTSSLDWDASRSPDRRVGSVRIRHSRQYQSVVSRRLNDKHSTQAKDPPPNSGPRRAVGLHKCSCSELRLIVMQIDSGGGQSRIRNNECVVSRNAGRDAALASKLRVT